MTRPLRALFVSEGALGVTVGHERLEPGVRAGLDERDDVEARFVSLPAQGLVAGSLVRFLPGLRSADLDLQTVRWLVVQALRSRWLLEHELRRAPVDVVHVVSHSIALGMVGAMRRVPVLLSLDAGIWAWRQLSAWAPLHRHSRAMVLPGVALERRALRNAALVLAWSEWARADIEREAPGVRAVTHGPGIDLAAFRPAARRPRDRPRVLFVGGRFIHKGGQDVLDAAAIARRTHEFDLDLATFEHVVAPPGVRLHRNIPRTDLVDLVQQADVVLAPTHGDTLSWAVVEAMACGAAVISTPVGALRETLGDAGVLVAPHRPDELASALTHLLDDPGLREDLGRAARGRAEERFDARRQTARLVELMHEAREAWQARRRTGRRGSRARPYRARSRG